LNSFDENIAVLKFLDIPNLGYFLKFSIALRSLTLFSRRLFKIENSDEYPNVQELFKFVKIRIQVLELAGEASSSSGTKDRHLKPSKFTKEWQKGRKPSTLLEATKPDDTPPSN